ncbi:DUF5107 domain-containing protein [Snuella lapsa]|uniref:DUF5107 domain-containing protein n=1 Tax=Snuella lapsa TaxID=870481 RepID=A0ABP6YF16_9FLAO
MVKTIKRITFLILLFAIQDMLAQKARITEEKMTMKTYMFSEPSPIPQIGRLYPYFRFDGYTDKAEDKQWNMVVMENDHIKVFVCPDIGGKIWGAIEKSTGKEFMYYNHVVKFRDVAMRGAWTSGGLEYNFGDIGHIPTCATPVDYRIKENDDGSVSCIVGALDLPSRTNWNVEIRLPKDKAYFETKASWFNNSDLPVTYYHWMNAAAKSKGNLEFLYPGNKRIGHGGELGAWPIEDGREINFYEKNNFGIYKSYHVINTYSDYFGGYYHDDDFGFGHYSLYDDKPGKKIWIWGLSDQGMIWEDLLTDSDGQYIEYQSGKLFNQAAASSTYTPFKHREFAPNDSDLMKEYWFPLKETKGMVAASPYGVLNIQPNEDKLTLFISALQNIEDDLLVKVNGNTLLNKKVKLSILQLHTETIQVAPSDDFEVQLGQNKLYYSSGASNVDRPVEPNKDFNWNTAYGLYVEGLELEKQRRYPEALVSYLESNKKEPGFLPTLNRLALSYYRIMQYDIALEYTKQAMAIDTYDGLANYNYGIINTALGNTNEAKSGFAIASHDIAYRSASYVALAKLFLVENQFGKAKTYLDKALSYNAFNITAHELQALIHRKEDQPKLALEKLKAITNLDATNVFVNSEQVFLNAINDTEFNKQITNELPYETYLELALKYKSFGCSEEALKILKLAPEQPMVLLWSAFLDKGNGTDYLNKALNQSVDLVFPHRIESVDMLQHLISENDHWKLNYYLGLIYWNKGLIAEAKKAFEACGNLPDAPVFYLSKAKLFTDQNQLVGDLLEKAYRLEPSNWRVNMALIEHYLEKNELEAALKKAKKFLKLYPEKSQFGMHYAKALIGLKKYDACIDFLKTFNVLPYEGATIGRTIYHESCVRAAYEALRKNNYKKAIDYAKQAKLWPKNLGVGKHYDVDERLDNFIVAFSLEQMDKHSEALKAYATIAEHNTPKYLNESTKLYLQLVALEKAGNTKEADQLLHEVLQHDKTNTYLKWVEAKYKNNNPDKIQQEIMAAGTEVQVYDTKFVDTEFELLIDLLSIIEK